MPTIGVFSNPSISVPVAADGIKPYAGDVSEVFTTSSVFESKKTLRFIKHADIYRPGSLTIGAELKTTSGSYHLGVFLNDGIAINLTGTHTAYTLRAASIGMGAYAEGIHELDFRLKNIGPGTCFLKLTDIYLID